MGSKDKFMTLNKHRKLAMSLLIVICLVSGLVPIKIGSHGLNVSRNADAKEKFKAKSMYLSISHGQDSLISGEEALIFKVLVKPIKLQEVWSSISREMDAPKTKNVLVIVEVPSQESAQTLNHALTAPSAQLKKTAHHALIVAQIVLGMNSNTTTSYIVGLTFGDLLVLQLPNTS
jgi:hypothetical protein